MAHLAHISPALSRFSGAHLAPELQRLGRVLAAASRGPVEYPVLTPEDRNALQELRALAAYLALPDARWPTPLDRLAIDALTEFYVKAGGVADSFRPRSWAEILETLRQRATRVRLAREGRFGRAH